MTIAEQLARAKVDYVEVYDAGFGLGLKSEYDRFWDTFQDYGNRTDWQRGVAGVGWNDVTFKPKYNIRVADGAQMFMRCAITNLTEILEAQNVTLDTSENKSFLQFFQTSTITHIPEIDISNATNTSYSFNTTSLIRIEKVIVSATTPFNNTFPQLNTDAFEYMIVEGDIAQNGFSCGQNGKLKKECIVSIINALSTTTQGLSISLGKKSVDTAFATSEGANDGSTSTEWTTLIATKSNWTISLI